jgi:hypothetical protein
VDAQLIRVSPKRDWATAGSAAVAREVEAAQGSERILDLEKAWAGIHFLLTAEVPITREDAIRLGISWDDDSLENALMGGRPTDLETSSGPVRYLDSDEISRIAAKLADISIEEFSDRYDPDALTEEQIPPDVWDNESEARDWLASSYAKLREFYQETAAQNAGLLIYLM